jgi:hypothetical protein
MKKLISIHEFAALTGLMPPSAITDRQRKTAWMKTKRLLDALQFSNPDYQILFRRTQRVESCRNHILVNLPQVLEVCPGIIDTLPKDAKEAISLQAELVDSLKEQVRALKATLTTYKQEVLELKRQFQAFKASLPRGAT